MKFGVDTGAYYTYTLKSGPVHSGSRKVCAYNGHTWSRKFLVEGSKYVSSEK